MSAVEAPKTPGSQRKKGKTKKHRVAKVVELEVTVCPAVPILHPESSKAPFEKPVVEEGEERVTWTDDSFHAVVYKILSEFKFSLQTPEVSLQSTLSSLQRMVVHEVCRTLGLHSWSFGIGKHRRVYIANPAVLCTTQGRYDYFVQRFRLVYFVGSNLELEVSKYAVEVDTKHQAKREQRDGPHHHVTIFHFNDGIKLLKDSVIVQDLVGELECDTFQSEGYAKMMAYVLGSLQTAIGAGQLLADYKLLGTGTVREAIVPKKKKEKTKQQTQPVSTPIESAEPAVIEYNQAWFVVLKWPALSALCTQLYLPSRDFHATLGFIKSDIHNPDLKKDETALIKHNKTS